MERPSDFISKVIRSSSASSPLGQGQHTLGKKFAYNWVRLALVSCCRPGNATLTALIGVCTTLHTSSIRARQAVGCG